MIRRARLSDVPQIVGLWHGLMDFHIRRTGPALALAPEAERKWAAFARKNIRSRPGLVPVAETGGRIVGYSLYFIKADVPAYTMTTLGHMSDLFVLEGYRGRGIASAFRKEAFRWFRRKGMTCASIVVHSINPHARGVYEGWGFREQHVEMRRRL